MTPQSKEPPEESIEAFEHPRGTLVIVSLFGLVFALGWIAMYLFVFLGRGGLHP
jgi:hypothetical protein